MSKSTRKPHASKATTDRPKKPYKDFPLYAHPLGYWSKKILGTIHHFGRWGRVVGGKLTQLDGDTWQAALQLYQAQREDLYAGRTPRAKGEGKGLTVADLCNAFLTAKHRKLQSGELGSRMFQEYRETTDLLIAAFGKKRLVDDLAADDFEKLRAEMAERWGPVRLGNAITRVKSVLKYGLDNGLFEKAIRYGSEFKKPDKAVLRRHRATSGEKMLEADELRQLIDAASVPLKAMLLLGVNAGFGNHDVATVPLLAIDLDSGWVDFPRPKTGITRRCPLWPETVLALRETLAQRPEPQQEAAKGLVFLTARGRPCLSGGLANPVGNKVSALLKQLGLHRDGVGFYTLRHVFRTIADAARDPVAIDLIMGHSDPSMGAHYRERIDDSRLQAVAEHVRSWLFGDTPDGGNTIAEPETTSEPCDPPQGDAGDARPTLKLFAG